jgi:dihydrofolate synthase/folylpolyglutamate synthase
MDFSTSTASSSVVTSAAAQPSDMDLHARYASLLNKLLTINSERKVRMGIQTTQRLLEALGPQWNLDCIPVIHVAGSNGKGSTTLKIARALELHGLRVGTYTSPHISSFRERISVNGRMISEQEIVDLLPPVLELARRSDIPATFFELGTALAWGHFRRAGVEVAVVEVGLGGRLDSTNVLRAPELSVICSISLEHTAWLGNSVEEIAREKAGILKAGRPALIGPTVPASVVRAVAAEVRAGPVEQMERQFDDYDVENSAMASRAVALAVENSPRLQALLSRSPAAGYRPELVTRGVRVRPPCRFQQVRWDAQLQRGEYLDEDGSGGAEVVAANRAAAAARGGGGAVEVVLDVCHNPAAFQRLFEKLGKEYAFVSTSSTAASPLPIRALVGFSSDKSYIPCLELMMQHCTQVWLVQADTPRAATAESVLAAAREHGQGTQREDKHTSNSSDFCD